MNEQEIKELKEREIFLRGICVKLEYILDLVTDELDCTTNMLLSPDDAFIGKQYYYFCNVKRLYRISSNGKPLGLPLQFDRLGINTLIKKEEGGAHQ